MMVSSPSWFIALKEHFAKKQNTDEIDDDDEDNESKMMLY